MLSIAAGGSAFKPYYRPDSLPPSTQESLKLVDVIRKLVDIIIYLLINRFTIFRKIYSDPDASFSSVSKEKGRRKRTTFSQHQAAVLEQLYLAMRNMLLDYEQAPAYGYVQWLVMHVFL
uniref:Peroxisomal membrane protein PEX16 n=1 Tax=Heterorhabditis bacteriophora TaxID=37862 RepID=A0A1I7XB56_HETBA